MSSTENTTPGVCKPRAKNTIYRTPIKISRKMIRSADSDTSDVDILLDDCLSLDYQAVINGVPGFEIETKLSGYQLLTIHVHGWNRWTLSYINISNCISFSPTAPTVVFHKILTYIQKLSPVSPCGTRSGLPQLLHPFTSLSLHCLNNTGLLVYVFDVLFIFLLVTIYTPSKCC